MVLGQVNILVYPHEWANVIHNKSNGTIKKVQFAIKRDIIVEPDDVKGANSGIMQIHLTATVTSKNDQQAIQDANYTHSGTTNKTLLKLGQVNERHCESRKFFQQQQRS